MRARMTGAVLALALVGALVAPAASVAQDPLPTITPTATPTPEGTATPAPSVTPTPTPTPEPEKKTKRTRRVYRDFTRDGVIEPCDHTRKTLRKTLKTITPEYEVDYPDFRDAVEAAIKDYKKDKCAEKRRAEREAENGGTAAPGVGTPTPVPTVAPAPAPAPPPAPAPDPGTLPETTPEPTPAPVVPTPEPTPVPTPAPPTPAEQEAQAIVQRPRDDASLLVPGILLAAALLGLAGAAGSALVGTRSERFASVGQAWREAAFRASGTWGDFTDWLRLGR